MQGSIPKRARKKTDEPFSSPQQAGGYPRVGFYEIWIPHAFSRTFALNTINSRTPRLRIDWESPPATLAERCRNIRRPRRATWHSIRMIPRLQPSPTNCAKRRPRENQSKRARGWRETRSADREYKWTRAAVHISPGW